MQYARGIGIGVLLSVFAAGAWAESPDVPVAIVRPERGLFTERLAAQEVRRYVYLRTGKLLPLADDVKSAPEGGLIVVGYPCVVGRKQFGLEEHEGLRASCARIANPQQYLLKTIRHDGRKILVVGGRVPGVLYGAYRLAEHLGVRFYLHGDVVPDRQIAWEIPDLDELGDPLFELRGIQPFHDFPEGPDWWNADAYKAIFAQLVKLRMNFFGLHTYPEGGVGPEPAAWIGLAEDFDSEGRVKFGYPSRHFTTANVTGAWGYRPTKTGDYTFGAAAIFPRDDFGADYMQGMNPWPQMSPEKSNQLFDRFGALLRDVFGYGRRLGIRTCLGTETPLVIPKPVQERLRKQGADPQDPKIVQKLYEGMFRRIMATHPLDYYWFWTPEGWTWQSVAQQQIDATLADFEAAIKAAKTVGAPFRLATCGWVLGPQQDRALFDKRLPKEMPLSCINRQVGHEPVEPGFAQVEGRPQWAIPWLEDDPAMIIPQLWVGRMRRDAADALQYGCTGLMGIHWRTRILGPNVLALAWAAWDQQAWNPALAAEAEPREAETPQEGPLGGKVAHFPDNLIAGTDDDPLYRTVRYDVDAYRINVPRGIYTVKLQFCEPHYTEQGKRVFGVKLEGKPVIENLDVFARVGQNKVLDYEFADVAVKDDQLSIEFTRGVEFPCIAAIVVEGPTAKRKINCGGPAYQDYAADLAEQPSGPPRHLPAADFYADWARAHFGDVAGESIGGLFARLDGRLPRPSTWVHGPGGIHPDKRPWAQVQNEYAFVDELAALRSKVAGAGNVERFDYWLANFEYLRAVGRVNCLWAEYNAALEKVKAEKDADARTRLARESALPLRRQLVAAVGTVHRHLLATVTTAGALGTVTNWQQHILPELLTKPGEELAKILGGPLAADALPPQQIELRPRVYVPVVRTMLVAGEPLTIPVTVVGAEPQEAVIRFRPLGADDWTHQPLEHVARGVYEFPFPAEKLAADFEYYVEVKTAVGDTLRFPPTAPTLSQTVVVVKD